MKLTLIFLVIVSFGVLAVQGSHPVCSATYCGTNGFKARCRYKSSLTSCGKWSRTTAAAISCKALTCNNSCYFIPVYGSDGNPYCTPCHLHKFSCTTGFKVYGPVDQQVSWTSRSASPGCSMEFCSLKGAQTKCLYGSGEITCHQFSYTPESKEQCAQFCIQICLIDGPFGSDGRQYCSLCHLQGASCQSRYKIYGPVEKPTVSRSAVVHTESAPTVPPASLEVCSMEFCTKNGAKAICLKNHMTSKKLTCGEWAKTPEKAEQCSFFCTLECLPKEEQPIDNTGTLHCTVCQLRSASCAADFEIYGPIGA